MKRIRAGLLALVALAGFQALLMAQQPASAKNDRFSVNLSAERIGNLDKIKKDLRDYQACTCKCGCYAKDIDLQADRAIAFLRHRAAHRKGDEKLTVVLDIDETTLSNYEEMQKADFAYNSAAFNAWVESAQAPAIAGTLRLFNEAKKLGVKIVFLTGRPEAQRAVTEKNLRAQGFQDWERLILRSAAEKGLTAREYKSNQRARLAAQGYVLVLSVGDQWSDLKGSPEAEFSVKYPNPYYFLP
jgi:acid phosphatase